MCIKAASYGIDGAYVDNSAYSFISRLDVYNGSNLLETISQYGALCNTILDVTLTESDKAGLSCMIGCNPTVNSIFTSPAAAIPVNTTYSVPIIQTMGNRSELLLNLVLKFVICFSKIN